MGLNSSRILARWVCLKTLSAALAVEKRARYLGPASCLVLAMIDCLRSRRPVFYVVNVIVVLIRVLDGRWDRIPVIGKSTESLDNFMGES